MKPAIIEKMSENRTRYTFQTPCKLGGILIVDLTDCYNVDGKSSLPQLWKKSGYINRVLKSWISVDIWAFDADGKCFGLYNPQILPGSCKLNFDWMFEVSEQNRQKILDEICARAF